MAKKSPKAVDDSAPPWLVTFGDLNSLLLCFFVLLFSLSEIKKSKVFEFIQSVTKYFQVETVLPNTPNPLSKKISFKQVLQELGRNYSSHPAKGGTEVENPFGRDTKVTHVQEGLKVRIGGRALFEAGSDELREDARRTLRDLATYVRGIPNKLDVRGHMSAQAGGTLSGVGGGDPGGFDLAYRRAAAVARYLIRETGFPQERIRISTSGEYEAVEDQVFEAEGQVMANRVEVIISEEQVREPGLEYEPQ